MIELTIPNVAKMKENEYLTYMNGEQLLELWIHKKITYNPEIQRGTKIKLDRKKNEIEVPVFSTSNVKKIYNAMVSDNYFSDLITINILKDSNSEIVYDKNVLKIKSKENNIADGQHRIRALEAINYSNLNLETAVDLTQFVFPVKITYYDISTAQNQFYQFSKGLKISSSRAEYFNDNGMPNKIIRKLMEKGNALEDRVEIVRNSITKRDTRHFVSFATLVNAIDMVYMIDNEEEAKVLAEYLNEFFKILFDTIEEFQDYDKRLESKEYSLIAENFMFYGYIQISKTIKDLPNWQSKIPLILDLDLNKQSALWYGKVTKKGKRTKQGIVRFGIINSSDSRKYMIGKIEKEFIKLLKE